MAEKEPFAYQAAKASWLAPVIAVGLSFFVKLTMQADDRTELGTKQMVILVSGALGLLVVLAGVVFAIYALWSIRTYGTKRILVPALIGIVLCSGYLYLLITAVQVAREAAARVGAAGL